MENPSGLLKNNGIASCFGFKKKSGNVNNRTGLLVNGYNGPGIPRVTRITETLPGGIPSSADPLHHCKTLPLFHGRLGPGVLSVPVRCALLCATVS